MINFSCCLPPKRFFLYFQDTDHHLRFDNEKKRTQNIASEKHKDSQVPAFCVCVPETGGKARQIREEFVICITAHHSDLFLRVSNMSRKSRILWRNEKFQDEMTLVNLRKTHALLRLADAVRPLNSAHGRT